jgi:23S rRNA U2552 (ribose-2'-O)-methylase RlmE/FtsJ
MASPTLLARSAEWKSVRECFDEHTKPGSRFITKFDNYFDVYDRYLSPFRERPVKLIEIGVQHGGSLQMWKRYLHPESIVVGVDIYPACKRYEEDGIKVMIGDQSDRQFLDSVVDQVGEVDIVIDDGSHIPHHQITTFEFLFQHGLKMDGVFLVEDCHTSYWRRYGGGVRRKGTFIEYAKDVIDDINYWHAEQSKKPRTWRTDLVESIEFYGSVVAFRKKRMSAANVVAAGDVRALDLDEPFQSGPFGKLAVVAKRSSFKVWCGGRHFFGI